MVAFYKHDISAWMDGTEGLSDGAYRVYHVVIQLIMLAEGPISLNERGIAGRCNRTVGAFRKALDELLEARKLTLRDGKLWNLRAEMELEGVRKNRENAGKGGKTRAFRQEMQENESGRSAKSLQNNDSPQAPLNNDPSLKEKRREDTPKAPKGAEPEGFAEFKAAYPPRSTVFPATPARKRWLEAIKRGAKPEEIIAGAKGYAAEQVRIGKAGTEYVQTADVWLNKQRWQDYCQPQSPTGDLATSKDEYLASLSADQWRDHIRRWRQSGGSWPLSRAGCAPPDAEATKVPPAILVEFGLLRRSMLAA